MGGVAVLHPQDVLRDGFNYNRMPLISPSRSTNQSLKTRDRKTNFISNSTPTPNPKTIANSNRRKRSPQKKGNDRSRSPPLKSSNLVMGKVKILKRGEALTNEEKDGKKDNKKEKVVVLEKNGDLEAMNLLKRLGPEPDIVLKQTRLADFYAGTGFVDSPDPSLLPVPSFFKKGEEEIEVIEKNDDNGSSHLRRLLNLAF